MNHELVFPPLENGLDYLQDAVRRLMAAPTPDRRDLKYAVLHLHAGVEVLLKCRLTCEDWRLIVADENDGISAEVTDEDYENGNFRSIGVRAALDRLQTLDGIMFTNRQKRALSALARFRNQLQHHGLTSSAAAVEARAVDVLGFALDFIDEHLAPLAHTGEVDEWVLADRMTAIRGDLNKITPFLKQRMQRFRSDVDKARMRSLCPDCGQWAVLLENTTTPRAAIPGHDCPRCAFCTRRWASREEYVDQLGHLDGVDSSADVDCPECGSGLFVWFTPTADEPDSLRDGLCFACQQEFNDECPKCGRPVYNWALGKENAICDDCFAERGRGD